MRECGEWYLSGDHLRPSGEAKVQVPSRIILFGSERLASGNHLAICVQGEEDSENENENEEETKDNLAICVQGERDLSGCLPDREGGSSRLRSELSGTVVNMSSGGGRNNNENKNENEDKQGEEEELQYLEEEEEEEEEVDDDEEDEDEDEEWDRRERRLDDLGPGEDGAFGLADRRTAFRNDASEKEQVAQEHRCHCSRRSSRHSCVQVV